jgi:hypothetical protein
MTNQSSISNALEARGENPHAFPDLWFETAQKITRVTVFWDRDRGTSNFERKRKGKSRIMRNEAKW